MDAGSRFLLPSATCFRVPGVMPLAGLEIAVPLVSLGVRLTLVAQRAQRTVRIAPPARLRLGRRWAAHSPAAGTFRVRQVRPTDAEILGTLVRLIDPTFFRPHAMTALRAAEIAHLEGRDVYLLGFVDGEAVAYGMLRGWDEGYAVPSLGVGVRRGALRMGHGRAMMVALHDAARRRGATRVRLRVHPENLAAQALYRSFGYRDTGVDRSEILMILDLQGSAGG